MTTNATSKEGSRRIKQAEKEFDELINLISRFVEKAAKTRDTAAFRYAQREKAATELFNFRTTRTQNRRYRTLESAFNTLNASPELTHVRSAVGKRRWPTLADFFIGLPDEYDKLGGRIEEVHKRQMRVAQLSRELADLLKDHRPEQYQESLTSKFQGLVAKHIMTPAWAESLDALRDRYAPLVARDKLRRIFMGVYLLDPSTLLTQLLKRYADVIEREPFNKYYLLLFRYTHGKLTKKEFVKRTVFAFLQHYWSKRRAPNKEAALIANAVLGLRGAAAVTANDITQMNKKTRRRYYKEE